MKVLFIDPSFGGIRGKTLSAALADLSGSAEPLYNLAEIISSIPGCEKCSLSVGKTKKGMKGTLLSLYTEDKPREADGDLYEKMELVIKELRLLPPSERIAREATKDICSALDNLIPYGESIPIFPLSETIFSTLGPLILLDTLHFSGCPVISTPPALGWGYRTLKMSMVFEILKRHRMAVAESTTRGALSSPVGVALLANIAEVSGRCPAMTTVGTGYGTDRYSGINPDHLMVVEGEISDLICDRIVILETNLDDVSGEIMGYTIERLFSEGAVDVFIIPAIGKKNRPVHMVSVITDHEKYRHLLKVLMEETGTLGVRVMDIPRVVADRSRRSMRVTISGCTFNVNVKTSLVNGKVISRKPEYEDLKRIAKTLATPIREVNDEIRKQLPGNHDE